MIINLHSFVDVITNSSTVIYTGVQENAIEAMKGIINEILRAAESHKTADDLFEISVISRAEIEKELLGREDIEKRSAEYWELVDDVEEKLSILPSQVQASDVGDAIDASVYTGAVIIVASKFDNPQTTVVSDLLGKIFSVYADYG
jgi:NifB/MoaA-like Fe-S oxidoreductase